MLIFHDPPTVLFSVPRTGSTAMQMALTRRADIALRAPARIKHLNVRGFEKTIAPELPRGGQNYERIAILRDPLDRLRSWYKYRQRPELRGSLNSTAHLSFDQFLDGVLSPSPPPWGDIGSQYEFIVNDAEELGVHQLFCVEKPAVYRQYLRAKLGPIDFKRFNASPASTVIASRTLVDRLKIVREKEYLLCAAVRRAGTLRYDF